MLKQLVLLSTFTEYNGHFPDWDFIHTLCEKPAFSPDIGLFWVWEIIIFDMRGGPELLFFNSENTFPTSLMTTSMRARTRLPGLRHRENLSLEFIIFDMREVGKVFSESKKRSFGSPLISKIIIPQTQNKSMSGENAGFSHKVWIKSQSGKWPLYSVKVLNKTSCFNMHIIYEIFRPQTEIQT